MATKLDVVVAVSSAASSVNKAASQNGLEAVNSAGQAIGAVASLTLYGLGITIASAEVTLM